MKSKKKSFIKILFTILSIIFLMNNVYLIVNIVNLHNIENMIRLVCVIMTILFTLLIIFLNIKVIIKKSKILYVLLIIINLIFIGAIGFLNVNFNIIYGKLNKVSTHYTTYSISLVTKADNSINSIKDIGNENIGVINDRETPNGYLYVEHILKSKNIKNKLVEYDNYFTIIDDLLNDKIEYAFLPSNYVEAFGVIDGYENLYENLKTIFETSKQEHQVTQNKSLTEPFTILLMGVDGVGNGIKNMTANGDSLILLTFNPNTFSTTMLSIPRDSYVPITCMGNKKNKIAHSALGGDKCMINTVQNLVGINIDYYAKINFNGIVQLVDTLGGIDVDIEYSFCEQNSNRDFGDNMIYVEKGFQTINGEQALAYSRNRHTNPEYCSEEWNKYYSDDFVRSEHQQEIIKAILNKIKNVKDINTIYNILNTISNNMETNMDVDTILSFYNVGKELSSKFNKDNHIDDIINIEKLSLSGYGATIYDYSQVTDSGSKLLLWDYVLYKGSVNDVIKAMKVNLGLESEDVIKDFSYDISNKYTKEVIGKKSYSEESINLLPDFVGNTKDYVQNYANNNGLKLTLEYVTDSSVKPNTVISQEPLSKMDLSEMTSNKGIKIVVTEGIADFDYTTCINEDKKDESRCQFKDYTKKSYADFANWLNKYTNFKKNITYSIIDENNENYDEKKEGLIESITIDNEPIKEQSIYELKDSKIVVKYYGKKTQIDDEN